MYLIKNMPDEIISKFYQIKLNEGEGLLRKITKGKTRNPFINKNRVHLCIYMLHRTLPHKNNDCSNAADAYPDIIDIPVSSNISFNTLVITINMDRQYVITYYPSQEME